jgi:hypothetical protein
LDNTKRTSSIRFLILNLSLAGILFLVFRSFSDYAFLPCTYAPLQPILLALASTLIVTIVLALFWRQQAGLSHLVFAVLLLVSLFLGSYRTSPLRLPIMDGFFITRHGRVNEVVASGDTITLSAGVPAAISIRSSLRNLRCRWSSQNGGAWDDPFSCDTTYMPPTADYDILHVRIEPGCKYSPVRGQLKISILP